MTPRIPMSGLARIAWDARRDLDDVRRQRPELVPVAEYRVDRLGAILVQRRKESKAAA